MADVKNLGLGNTLLQIVDEKGRELTTDKYSETSSYAIGDYAIYDDTLYRCTTAIGAGGESWNSSHWAETSVAGELSTLNSSLTQLLPNMTFGSPTTIPWTNDKFTCPSAGIITGYIRKSANSTAGLFGLQSSAIPSDFRAIINLYTSNEYADLNMIVAKNEELTIGNKTEIGTIHIVFLPFA